MESDKSVYAVVAIFALILIIVGGIVVFYIFDSFVSKVKDNTGKPPALIASIRRVLQNVPIGVAAELTANQIYKDEISQRKEEENMENENNIVTEKAHVCGNGILEKGEECEDPKFDCDYGKTCNCDTNCKKADIVGPYCSDGLIQKEFGEECDDRNLVFGDGCDNKCKKEIISEENGNLRNGCWELSSSVKLKILELKQNSGNVIVLEEGGIAYTDNYIIILTKNGGSLLKVGAFNNVGSNVKLYLVNAISGESYEIILDGEGKGTFILDEKTIYLIKGVNENFVRLTWGPGADYGKSGDVKDAFICESSCKDSDMNSEYLNGKNVKEKGFVEWKDENGAGGTMYDECYLSNLSKVYENYCEGNKFKRELVDCQSGGACYDGYCKTEGVCGNRIIEDEEVCDPPGESDCVINGYPGKQECLNFCLNWWKNCYTNYYCGDFICNGLENATNCGIDCGVAICGNGLRERGEGCDDGNTQGGDGCSSICGIERACEDGDSNEPDFQVEELYIASNVTGFDIYGRLIVYRDSCSSIIPGGVLEYSCLPDNGGIRRSSIACPSDYSCSNGACVVVSPSPDGNSILEEIWKRLIG